ncbi:MAG TPA: hypothetical protein PLK80_14020, partial [bacterium]|nr:hypothetical protein [bacterium]
RYDGGGGNRGYRLKTRVEKIALTIASDEKESASEVVDEQSEISRLPYSLGNGHASEKTQARATLAALLIDMPMPMNASAFPDFHHFITDGAPAQ